MIVELISVFFKESVRTPGEGQSSQERWFTREQRWKMAYHVDLQLIEIKRDAGSSAVRWVHASNMQECQPDLDSVQKARQRQKAAPVVG